MAANINRVVLTGNLTADPEKVETSSSTTIVRLRVASNTRRKVGEEWKEVPNFFDVTVFGAQGENCVKFLAKGRPIALDGRLEWREWADKDGNKRQAVGIIADAIQFLGENPNAKGGGEGEQGPDLPF